MSSYGTAAVRRFAHEAERQLPLAKVPLEEFKRKLARALPRLIEFVCSAALRNHPLWGTAIPYHVPTYGTGVSLGHCVRPDILMTASGPKICELDFVPSGRGYLLSGLGREQQCEVLKVFTQWYKAMRVSRILYATASRTVSAEDAQLFARMMREFGGIDIRAVNIDDIWQRDLRGAFVDRLSYRTEMRVQRDLGGCEVATAEPWLDSKAIFAMVHDDHLTEQLEAAIGADNLSFLREVMPRTRLVQSIKDTEYEGLVRKRSSYVIKNTDVETDDSWGCRGTVPGLNYTGTKFWDALKGTSPNGKNTGSNPILQEWHQSVDFRWAWDGVLKGEYARTHLRHRGKQPDPATQRFAQKKVGARIGFYFLIVRGSGECFVTPYADTDLRQDNLIHGASDAIGLPMASY